jgi:hypothetical protein
MKNREKNNSHAFHVFLLSIKDQVYMTISPDTDMAITSILPRRCDDLASVRRPFLARQRGRRDFFARQIFRFVTVLRTTTTRFPVPAVVAGPRRRDRTTKPS